MQIERTDVGEIMSQAVVHGDMIYLAGQVSSVAADVAGQTQGVLDKIDTLLAKIGVQKTRILSATIYLADISTFTEMNDVWKKWVPVGAAPARTTVEAKLAMPEFLVEITVVACR
ncbi:MAG: RidA family protein [Alphaproteobacteria bacterium]|nr:RidA family protein [Alphaproteobacteria bacterium]